MSAVRSVLHLLEGVQTASGTLGGHCISNLWLTKSGKFLEQWDEKEKNEAKAAFTSKQHAGVTHAQDGEDGDLSESDASEDETVCRAHLSHSHPPSD